MVLNPNEQTKVQTLNAAWRKYLVTILGLDKTFKLAQGTLGLGSSDNSGLFRISDNVPRLFWFLCGNEVYTDRISAK